MRKTLSKIVTIAMLVAMFSTTVNLCTASAFPNFPQQKVTNHHKIPSKPVKPPKPTKCIIPTLPNKTPPTIPCNTTPPPCCSTPPCKTTPPALSNFTISIGDASTSPNEYITLPVYFDNIQDGIYTLGFDIAYDPTQLEYIFCEPGNIVPDPTNSFNSNKPTDGTLKFLFCDTKPESELIKLSGIFSNLKFKVIGTSNAVTRVNISNAVAGDFNIKKIDTNVRPGKVEISVPVVETPTPPIVTPTPISSFEITVGSKEALPNENISLPIYFDDIPEGGIAGFDFKITYDPKELEYTSYEAGSIIPNSDINLAAQKNENGKVTMLFLDYTAGSESITSCGIAAKLNFKVIGTSYEVTHIKVGNITVSDKNLNEVATSSYQGSVIIECLQTPIPTFSCNIGSTKAYAGDIITLPMNFENISDKGIATCDMTIKYTPKSLEFVNCEAGSIVKNADTNFKFNKVDDGTIKILFLDDTMKDEYINSNGIFANLTFKVLNSDYKSSQVNVVYSSFADIDLNTIKPEIGMGIVQYMGPSRN